MKRLKRVCDADNHVSSRLAIRNTPKTPQYLQILTQHRCRTCIEIFFDYPATKKAAFFRNLIRIKASKDGIKDLIEVYPDILQLRNVEGDSLLHVAIQLNRSDVVQMILELDEESLDNDLLKYAIDQKQSKVCEILIRPEILNRICQSDVESAFKATIRWSLCPGKVFSALLPKMKRKVLREALNICIEWDNFATFKAILLHDKTLVNVYGPDLYWNTKHFATTPLHVAMWNHRYRFVDFILDNFGEMINLELRDSNEWTVFQIAIELEAPLETLYKFLTINSQLIYVVFDVLDDENEGCILFDLSFGEDALEVYPFEDLLKLTALSFRSPNSVISDKCLKAFYTCEGNSERSLVERAQTILKLDEIDLNVSGKMINGRIALLWLHEQVHESMIPDPDVYNESGLVLVLMIYYTEAILKHLSETVWEDEEKLTVFLEIVSKIHVLKVFRTHGISIEEFFIPKTMPPKDPKTPNKLQIISDALCNVPWDFYTEFIIYILLNREVDVIKDFIKIGLFQLYLAYTPTLFIQIWFSFHFGGSTGEEKQKQDLMEPFFSIRTRKRLGLHNKPLALKDLARLSLLDQLENSAQLMWNRNDILDAIRSFEIPTTQMNYLLYMDQTPLKVYHD